MMTTAPPHAGPQGDRDHYTAVGDLGHIVETQTLKITYKDTRIPNLMN